jgi:hypothetical protein
VSERYYTLQASLPPLPFFATAARLPINEARLRQRTTLLAPSDRLSLDLAMELVRWRRQLPEGGDQRVARLHRRFVQECTNAELKAFVDFRMGLRAVVAALRRLRRHAQPAPGELMGFGHWDAIIRRRWNQPGLGLEYVYPWIAEARWLLEAGDALALERLLMEAVWRRLKPLADTFPFRFEAIFAYFFKWDILARWVEFDAGRAEERFAQLLDEVTSGKQTTISR